MEGGNLQPKKSFRQGAGLGRPAPTAAMRLALAALLASAGALAPGAGVSRRAVLGQAAAATGAGAVLLAPLLAPLPAGAQELKQACRPRSALALAAHPGAHNACTSPSPRPHNAQPDPHSDASTGLRRRGVPQRVRRDAHTGARDRAGRRGQAGLGRRWARVGFAFTCSRHS